MPETQSRSFLFYETFSATSGKCLHFCQTSELHNEEDSGGWFEVTKSSKAACNERQCKHFVLNFCPQREVDRQERCGCWKNYAAGYFFIVRIDDEALMNQEPMMFLALMKQRYLKLWWTNDIWSFFPPAPVFWLTLFISIWYKVQVWIIKREKRGKKTEKSGKTSGCVFFWYFFLTKENLRNFIRKLIKKEN